MCWNDKDIPHQFCRNWHWYSKSCHQVNVSSIYHELFATRYYAALILTPIYAIDTFSYYYLGREKSCLFETPTKIIYFPLDTCIFGYKYTVSGTTKYNDFQSLLRVKKTTHHLKNSHIQTQYNTVH
jgi:hypothetical protein